MPMDGIFTLNPYRRITKISEFRIYADITAYRPNPFAAIAIAIQELITYAAIEFNPIRLKLRSLYRIAFPTLIMLCKKMVDDISCSGMVSVPSATKLAIHGAMKKRIMEQVRPNIMLSVNAVEMCCLEASFFCITAEPNPASDRLIHIAIIPIIAAKYPKSTLDNRRDIMAKYRISKMPIVIVTMV